MLFRSQADAADAHAGGDAHGLDDLLDAQDLLMSCLLYTSIMPLLRSSLGQRRAREPFVGGVADGRGQRVGRMVGIDVYKRQPLPLARARPQRHRAAAPTLCAPVHLAHTRFSVELSQIAFYV